MTPRLLKVAPACAIMISTYEYGKNYFARRNGMFLDNEQDVGWQVYLKWWDFKFVWMMCKHARLTFVSINMINGLLLVLLQVAVNVPGEDLLFF